MACPMLKPLQRTLHCTRSQISILNFVLWQFANDIPWQNELWKIADFTSASTIPFKKPIKTWHDSPCQLPGSTFHSQRRLALRSGGRSRARNTRVEPTRYTFNQPTKPAINQIDQPMVTNLAFMPQEYKDTATDLNYQQDSQPTKQNHSKTINQSSIQTKQSTI